MIYVLAALNVSQEFLDNCDIAADDCEKPGILWIVAGLVAYYGVFKLITWWRP